MRRIFALLLICLLPFAAAGQSVGGDEALAQQLLGQPSWQVMPPGQGNLLPLWRGNDGRMLMLKADRGVGADALRDETPLAFHAGDAGSLFSTGLRYQLAPGMQAHAEISEHSWANRPARLIGGEVGATYNAGRYSVGLSVATSDANRSVALPRVLPGAVAGVDGLSGFDSSAQFNAHGRLALGSKSGIDLGASVGRIHLLPGNVLGVNTLDQKALSFGVDRGPISGTLVGRTMQPLAGSGGIPGGLNPEQRWTSIDLGVTWRLPWQGALSIGAQNLWSSGTPANTPVGPEPDQSRTPYVQYHQDL